MHSTNTLKKKKKSLDLRLKVLGALESDCLGPVPAPLLMAVGLLTHFLSCKMRNKTLLLRRAIEGFQREYTCKSPGSDCSAFLMEGLGGTVIHGTTAVLGC